MTVTEAVLSRLSVRGFLPTPVPLEQLRDILEIASRAPSGGNLQPWHLHVLTGEPLAALKRDMAGKLADGGPLEEPEYAIYPEPLGEPYRSRRYRNATQLYDAVGIPREEKARRRAWFARNYQCFGAPVLLLCYVDRGMGKPQWADLGMYLQTVMLLLRESGLDSCPQEAWSVHHQTVRGHVSADDDHMLFCGLSIGYRDPDEPANALVTERDPVSSYASFYG